MPDGSITVYRFCQQHLCRVDQCLTDGDCAAGQVCNCASQFGGNGFHNNACIATGCRVDADCGAGGFCSPATNNRCGGVAGYYCHGAADTCDTDADCPDQNDGGILPRKCAYVPEVNHWQCAAMMFCNG